MEYDDIAALKRTIAVHDRDPMYYAVPGTTHRFVPWPRPKRRFERFRKPLTTWFGKGCCGVCGTGEKYHAGASSNQAKPGVVYTWRDIR